MDALLACALEEIAAEGPSGCPLHELWAQLDAASRRLMGTPLAEDPSSQECLWRRLLGCSAVAALISSPMAGAVPFPEPPETTAGMGRPGAGSLRISSVQESHAGTSLPFPHLLSLGRDPAVPGSASPAATGASPPPGAPEPGRKRKGAAPVLPSASGDSQSGSCRYRILGGSVVAAREGSGATPWGVQQAEQAGVVLVASPGLRSSAVGLYEEAVVETGLNAPMLLTLQHLARARQRGVSQAQLARDLRIKNNNFHYVLHSLESRGLIVTHEMVCRDATSGAPCRTNIVHLARYASLVQLKEQQRFEEAQGPAPETLRQHPASGAVGPSPSPGAPAGAEQQAERSAVAGLEVLDDLPALARICQHLQGAQGRVLVRAELKASLGYRFTQGHRAWRRLQRKLEITGMADVFEASVDDKVVTCVRLLREWDEDFLRRSLEAVARRAPASASVASDGDGRGPTEVGSGTEATEPGAGAAQGEGVEEAEEDGSGEQLFAELCAEQQIVDQVESTGSEGVLQPQLAFRVGIPKKKFYRQVAALVEAKVLVAEPESHNRSTVYRLKVPRWAVPPEGALPLPASGAEAGPQVKPLEVGGAPGGSAHGAPHPGPLSLVPVAAPSTLPGTAARMGQQGPGPHEPLPGPTAAAGDGEGAVGTKARGRGQGVRGRGQTQGRGRGGRGGGTTSSPEAAASPRVRGGGRARGTRRVPASAALPQGPGEDATVPAHTPGIRAGQGPGLGASSSLPCASDQGPGLQPEESALQLSQGVQNPLSLPVRGTDGAGQGSRLGKERPRRRVGAPGHAPVGASSAAGVAEPAGASKASPAGSPVTESADSWGHPAEGAGKQKVGVEKGGVGEDAGGQEGGGAGEAPAVMAPVARRRKIPRNERLIRRREEIILEHLKEHRVAARWELHKRIREAESEEWAAGAGTGAGAEARRHTMDRKTLERLLEGLRARRLLQRVVVSVPGATNGGILRNLDLLLAPDAAVTEEGVASLLAKHRMGGAGEQSQTPQGPQRKEEQQRPLGGGAERPQGAHPAGLMAGSSRGRRESGAGVKVERTETPEAAAPGTLGVSPEGAGAVRAQVPVLVGVERRPVGRQMDAERRRAKGQSSERPGLNLGTSLPSGGASSTWAAALSELGAASDPLQEPRLLARLAPASSSMGEPQFGAMGAPESTEGMQDGNREASQCGPLSESSGATAGGPVARDLLEAVPGAASAEEGRGQSSHGRGGSHGRAGGQDPMDTPRDTRKAFGYVPARMVRARLLHLCLWERLRPNLGVQRQGRAPAEARQGQGRSMAEGPSSSHPLAFVLEDAIMSLPLHSFLQILGVGTTEGLDVESLERNALGGCTLGDLSPEERTQLWDPAARQRASMLLRLLQRLGVVSLDWGTPGVTARGAGAASEGDAGAAGDASGPSRRPLPAGSGSARPGLVDSDGGMASLAYQLEREVSMQYPDSVDLWVQGGRASPAPLGTSASRPAGEQGEPPEARGEAPALVLLAAISRTRDGRAGPSTHEGHVVGAEQGVVRRSEEGHVVTLVWDVQTEAGLRCYWSALQVVYTRLQTTMGGTLFPASAVPEVMQARMWSSVGLMTIQQRRDLTLRLEVLEALRLHQEGQQLGPDTAGEGADGTAKREGGEAGDGVGEERKRLEARLAPLLYQRRDVRSACESIALELGLSTSQVTAAMYQRNARRRYMALQSTHQILGPGVPSAALLGSGEGAGVGQGRQSRVHKRPSEAWEEPLLQGRAGAGAGARGEPQRKLARGSTGAQLELWGVATAGRRPRASTGWGAGDKMAQAVAAAGGKVWGGGQALNMEEDEEEEEEEEEEELDEEGEEEEGEDEDEEGWGAGHGGGTGGSAGSAAGMGFAPVRGRRVVWTEVATRMLLEEYLRFRAVHRKMQWIGQAPQMLVLDGRAQQAQGAAEGLAQLAMRAQGPFLPHPPLVCRRHMAALRSDPGTRAAIATLCSLMARRYESWKAWARTKYQKQQQQQKQQDQERQGPEDGQALVPQPPPSGEELQFREELESTLLRPLGSAAQAGAEGGGAQGKKRRRRGRGEVLWESGTPWDDFNEPTVRAAVDRVLHAHYALRPWVVRRRFSGRQLSSAQGPPQPLRTGAFPGHTSSHSTGPAAGGSGRARGSGAGLEVLGRGGGGTAEGLAEEPREGGRGMGMSVAVSCAAELLQAVLLNTGPSGQIPVPLVQCLRGFSRDQVEEASKFLHDQGIMVQGKGAKTYDLNPSFVGGASPALVPPHGALDAAELDAWAGDAGVGRVLEEEGTALPPSLRFGHTLRLLSLAAQGAWRLEPALPQDPASVGESPEDGGPRDAPSPLLPKGVQRRVRGFPGLAVRLCRGLRDPARLLSTAQGLPGGDQRGEEVLEGDAILASADEISLQGTQVSEQCQSPADMGLGEGGQEQHVVGPEVGGSKDASGSCPTRSPGSAEGAPATGTPFSSACSWPALSGSLWDLPAEEQHCLLRELRAPAQAGAGTAGSAQEEGHQDAPADGAASAHLVAFLRQVLVTVRAQGDAGCQLSQLQGSLGVQRTAGSVVPLQDAVDWLVSFELLVQVSGYDAVHLLAPEHAAHLFFTVPQPVEGPGPGPCSEQAAAAAGEASLPDGGGVVEGALALPGLSGTDLVPAVTKQGGLSMAPAECAPPRPTAQARPAEGRQGPPACTPLDGDGALAGGVEDAAREAGTQGSTPGRGTEGADDPPENLASGSVESQGEEGALRRPIRPWLCPDGSTHKELLHNLCRRIVGLIFNLPGVSQDVLLELVPALHPQTCRDVLTMLEADKAIRVRACSLRPTTSRPPSLLRPLSSRQVRAVPEQGASTKHYFLGDNHTAWM